MKRRDMMLKTAAAAGSIVAPADAQQPAAAAANNTVYIPPRHRVEDLPYLQDFMDEFSFVDLVTATPELHVTHIPVLLDRAKGSKGTIFGHIAKANAQTKALFDGAPATIVFHGPHSYISPAWYSKPMQAVPTWNFAAVHASGKLRATTEPKELHALLSKLVAKFEKSYVPNPTYQFDKLPDTYINGMLGGIVGFQLQIDNLEGKFKLGHERSEQDRQGVLEGLKTAKPERDIQHLTAAFYKREAQK